MYYVYHNEDCHTWEVRNIIHESVVGVFHYYEDALEYCDKLNGDAPTVL